MSSRPASRNAAAPTMVTASTSFHHFMSKSPCLRRPHGRFASRVPVCPYPGTRHSSGLSLEAVPAGAVPGGLAGRARRGHDDGMGIEPEAVASYVDRAVEAMADIVGDLGDDLANTRPGLPGANSPYAILRHCLGVMEFWGGHVVAGRAVDRDRAAGVRASRPAAGPTAAAQGAPRPVPAGILAADPKARPPGRAAPPPAAPR